MRTMLAALGTSILLAGCTVLTVHPPFADRNQIFDGALEGAWGAEDEEGIYYFLEGTRRLLPGRATDRGRHCALGGPNVPSGGADLSRRVAGPIL